MRAGAARRRVLGRKALAALRTTTGKNPLAAGRQHTLAKAVAALANEAARLIGALHGSLRPGRLRPIPLDGKRIMLVFPMLRKAAAPGLKPEQDAISPEFGLL